MTLIQRLIELLIKDEPERVFEAPAGKGKIVGYELSITLRNPDLERWPFVRIPLLSSGSGYLLTKDASNKYGLSAERIQALCRARKVEGRKNKRGWWEVKEESLETYLAGK